VEIASADIDPDLSRRMGMQRLRRPAAPAPAVAPVRTALFPAMAFEPRSSDRGLRSLAGRVDVEGLSLNYLTDFYGSAVTVREDPWDGYCISTVLRGRIYLQPTPQAEPIAGGGPVGLILRGRPGYRMLTGDRSARLNLWFQTKAVARRLEALTDGVARGELEFHPTIDWQSAQGASIARLVAMARDEFGQPGSLLSHATGRAAFEEMLATEAIGRAPRRRPGSAWRRAGCRLHPAAACPPGGRSARGRPGCRAPAARRPAPPPRPAASRANQW
jgi:hypothetical protein